MPFLLFGCNMWDLSLHCIDSLAVACCLSCFTACGILVPPPGMEPVSPTLQGRFLTTGPRGKSLKYIFLMECDLNLEENALISQGFGFLFKFFLFFVCVGL